MFEKEEIHALFKDMEGRQVFDALHAGRFREGGRSRGL